MRRATALAVALALLLPGAAAAACPQTSVADLEDEIMCPVCGTSLATAGDAPLAVQQRRLIDRLVQECRSKDEIKDALVAQYGPNVLATPSGHGFDLTAWIVPGLVIGLVIVGLGIGAVRLGRRGRPPDSPPPLDPSDEARLDRDLSSYDI